MTYLYTVPAPEPPTEEVTEAADIGSTEFGTTESETTGMFTTECMIHLRSLGVPCLYGLIYIFFHIDNEIHLVLVIIKSRL